MSRPVLNTDLIKQSMDVLYTKAQQRVENEEVQQRIANGEIVPLIDCDSLEHSLLRSRVFNAPEDKLQGYSELELSDQAFYVVNKREKPWLERLALRADWRKTEIMRSAESMVRLPEHEEIKLFLFVIMDNHDEGFRLRVSAGHSNFLALMSEKDFDNSYGLIKDVKPEMYDLAYQTFQKVLVERKRVAVKA